MNLLELTFALLLMQPNLILFWQCQQLEIIKITNIKVQRSELINKKIFNVRKKYENFKITEAFDTR